VAFAQIGRHAMPVVSSGLENQNDNQPDQSDNPKYSTLPTDIGDRRLFGMVYERYDRNLPLTWMKRTAVEDSLASNQAESIV
jgi:hypothetical protein